MTNGTPKKPVTPSKQSGGSGGHGPIPWVMEKQIVVNSLWVKPGETLSFGPVSSEARILTAMDGFFEGEGPLVEVKPGQQKSLTISEKVPVDRRYTVAIQMEASRSIETCTLLVAAEPPHPEKHETHAAALVSEERYQCRWVNPATGNLCPCTQNPPTTPCTPCQHPKSLHELV